MKSTQEQQICRRPWQTTQTRLLARWLSLARISVVLDTKMENRMRNVGSVAVPVVIVGTLTVLIFLLIEGILDPRRFAISCATTMVLAVIVWSVLLRRNNQLSGASAPSDRSSILNLGKKSSIQMILLVLLMATAFWVTRGGPWIPRLIGASMLIVFMVGIALRKPK
jgi:hypothetical protein